MCESALTLWRGMSRFRKIMLAAMLIFIVGFGAATVALTLRPGLGPYRGSLLYPQGGGETRRYAGRIDDEAATLSISPDGVIEYTWGAYAYGPYQVVEDPSACSDPWLQGIEIRQGDEVLFRGGYYGGGSSLTTLHDGSGEPLWDDMLSIVYGESGNAATQEDLHAPRLSTLARWVLEPEELTHRGSLSLYFGVTLIALFNILLICFPGFFFRWSIRWHVREPEKTELSDFHIAMERAEWVLLAVAVLVLYWMNLDQIV